MVDDALDAALVVLRPGCSMSDDAIRSHLASCGFARWQHPEWFELVAEIPETGVGKVDKKAIRARLNPAD